MKSNDSKEFDLKEMTVDDLFHAKEERRLRLASLTFLRRKTVKPITAARGSFHMQFSHYDPVPNQIAQKIIQQAKDDGRIRAAEED